MEDILQRLPHRPPFVMIDQITTDGVTAQAHFTIKADNVLAENGFFSESGLVEHMAQAAGAGLLQRAGGSGPVVGYIGALKDLQIEKLPAVGDTITTAVSYLHQVMSTHIVKAEVVSQTG